MGFPQYTLCTHGFFFLEYVCLIIIENTLGNFQKSNFDGFKHSSYRTHDSDLSTGLISMSSIFCCKISSVISQSAKVISVCAECILFQSAKVASMHELEAIDSV